ncbi:ABC transporter ATP-binding protein [Enorma burkinafasonensis]|uniref:ABC transporter ATP-binding protein n=1 Tax=Enorma burkinafasonensis TaxID=2590867 RepID=UPI0026F32E1A|nr:ABC transporter ATP-binding protein [Enorma burkinafasonensis]MCI7730848.1 ABC transporter ATP-binding protein/permease [Enorma burkinafasonensis]
MMREEKGRRRDEERRGRAVRPLYHDDYDDEQDAEVPRDPFGVIRRLWEVSDGEHWRFAVVLVSIVCYTVTHLSAPLYSAHLIDLLWAHIQDAFAQGRDFMITWETGGRECLVFLGIWTLAWAFYTLQAFTMASFAERLNLKLRRRVAGKLNVLPLKYYDAHKPGDVMSRVTNDLDKVSEVLQRGLLSMLIAVGSVIGAVIMMMRINYVLAVVFLAFAASAVFMTRAVAMRTLVLAAHQQRAVGVLTGHVEEAYSGRIVIRAFNQERASSERIHRATQRLADTMRMTDFTTNVVGPMVRCLVRFSQVVLALLGTWFLIGGRLTIGTLQAFFQYVNTAAEPLTQFSLTMNQLQSALAAVERVFDILDEDEIEPDPAEPALAPSPVSGRVAFEHVRFGYDPERPLMKDVSFVAEPGQKVAIVGATGAGKTTLINLLMRFYEIDGGKITLDGVDTHAMRRSDLRRNFGMVLQDAWLREGSIADNIAYGCDGATREEVMQAAKTAQVDFFVRTMPHGYDTELANDAENISQGQRQLLTIARVLLANPSILILDEATSSVDTRTEKAIVTAMEKLTHGRTSFVIAHRLSTIVDSDLILVMDHGTIIEQGTHEELLAAGGAYAELYNSQFA